MSPNPQPDVIITTASADDATAIVQLLTPNVVKNSILPRSTDDIVRNIESFRVAREDNRVVGCVAIKDYGQSLFEIRSLAVADHASGQGLGTRLLNTIIRLALKRGATEIFTLTVRPNLFRRLLFNEVSKEQFPQKIWSDCASCKKRQHCDEVALTKRFADEETS